MTTNGDPAQRVNGITYLQIPSPDPGKQGDFYKAVFGWELRGDPDRHLGFSDSTGHVIGAFVRDLTPAGDSGLLPYVFVSNVEETLGKVTGSGGDVVKAPYREPPDAEEHLTVATFRDVAGNVVGLWQVGSP